MIIADLPSPKSYASIICLTRHIYQQVVTVLRLYDLRATKLALTSEFYHVYHNNTASFSAWWTHADFLQFGCTRICSNIFYNSGWLLIFRLHIFTLCGFALVAPGKFVSGTMLYELLCHPFHFSLLLLAYLIHTVRGTFL